MIYIRDLLAWHVKQAIRFKSLSEDERANLPAPYKASKRRGHVKTSEFHSAAAGAITNLLSQVEALTLENQRLRLDAQRYRWLRNEANKEPAAAPFVFFCDPNLPLRWVDAIYGEQLDADIDAARAQIDKEKP
jgi:hypothetical protein